MGTGVGWRGGGHTAKSKTQESSWWPGRSCGSEGVWDQDATAGSGREEIPHSPWLSGLIGGNQLAARRPRSPSSCSP